MILFDPVGVSGRGFPSPRAAPNGTSVSRTGVLMSAPAVGGHRRAARRAPAKLRRAICSSG